MWGVSASRFLDFSPGHVHFGIKTPSGVQFGGAGSKTMAKVGGSVANPTAANAVKMSKLDRWKVLKLPKPKSVADVAFVFAFPAILGSPSLARSEPARCVCGTQSQRGSDGERKKPGLTCAPAAARTSGGSR